MKRKSSEIAKLTKQLMEENEIDGVVDLQSMLKEMLKQGVETLLEAELDEELGYNRYDNNLHFLVEFVEFFIDIR
ncbi:hypothetical protein [Alkalibacter mobilis]|uniref:hypothetical protein n=1 Tax=Alkalibacter mobilis TaxID=2787712 RepID=UPI00189DBC40|nr:hypothetical protein [Alkalibacter mobilis]MBF7097782.1 hypothetical protein [Alkalibacter mobilis]